MKKIIIIALLLGLTLVSCNQSETEKKAEEEKVNSDNLVTESETTSVSKKENDNTLTYAKIGDEITGEKFVYRINKVEFLKSIGNKTSDGVYAVINLSLKNISKEKETLKASLFTLTDESGTEFSNSLEGTLALEKTGKKIIFLEDCNPQINKQVYLCFEVPQQGVYDLHLTTWNPNAKSSVIKLTN